MSSYQPTAEDYVPLLTDPTTAATTAAMGQEEQQVKPEGRSGDTQALYMALAAAVFTTVVTWWIVFTNQLGWFPMHPLLISLGMVVLTYGVLTLQPTSQPKTKEAGFSRHQLSILLLAVPLILAGAFSVYHHKSLGGHGHLVSWHGTFGLACVLWIVVQILLGGGSVWVGGAAFGGGTKAKGLWKYHRASGYALLLLLLFTVHLAGMYSNWTNRHANMFIRIAAYTIAPGLVLGSIYARVRTSKMRFF